MNPDKRKRFDALLERVLASLPARLRELLDEAPLIVEDHPDPKLLEDLGMDQGSEELCGLHTGTPLTERSLAEGAEDLEMIHMFRQGIVEEAGGWDASDEALAEEIRITLLHEIGHHFGLEEDDLESLGYD